MELWTRVIKTKSEKILSRKFSPRIELVTQIIIVTIKERENKISRKSNSNENWPLSYKKNTRLVWTCFLRGTTAFLAAPPCSAARAPSRPGRTPAAAAAAVATALTVSGMPWSSVFVGVCRSEVDIVINFDDLLSRFLILGTRSGFRGVESETQSQAL